MAKKSSKKKSDPLATLLKMLARADRDCARAVRLLCKAILTPVQEPSFKLCKFKYGKKTYSAILTTDHCRAIKKVAKEKGNVPHEVGLLLGEETQQVASSIMGLMTALDESAKVATVKPIQLGCCSYQGGESPNLSQAQCNQITPSTWDSGDPSCTNTRPKA